MTDLYQKRLRQAWTHDDEKWSWRDSQRATYQFPGLKEYAVSSIGVSIYDYPPGRDQTVRFTAFDYGREYQWPEWGGFVDVAMDPVQAAKMAVRTLRFVAEISPETSWQAMHLLEQYLPRL